MNVCLFGYTGRVGKELADQLSRRDEYNGITLIGRRKVEMSFSHLSDEEKLRIKYAVVDFSDDDQIKESMSGCQLCFFAIGSAASREGKEAFYKVDYTLTLKVAKIARDNGVLTFNYVSSMGANINSKFFYLKTKGEVEDGLKKLGFLNGLIIYRPAALQTNNSDQRTMEKIGLLFLKPVELFKPNTYVVKTAALAVAIAKCPIVIDTYLEKSGKTSGECTILENKDIVAIYQM